MFGIREKLNNALINSEHLTFEEQKKVKRIENAWNFYEGYHWEGMTESGDNEITLNYCRAYVDKFVAFELGKSFSITMKKDIEKKLVTPEGKTLFEYLECVWVDNQQYTLCTEIGQMKSVTGEAWIQVKFLDKTEIDDPFNEFEKEKGKIGLFLVPTHTVFPTYDPHIKGKLIELKIQYRYKRKVSNLISDKTREEEVLYQQIWNKDKCVIRDGGDVVEIENPYGIIPFVQINNLPIAGKNCGRGDLDDIIPINVELNQKESAVSEIIDYHSAPITIVYGARVSALEKGANKIWGGLSKDARVENLTLQGDLGASNRYIDELKNAMNEIGGIPQQSLGGASNISNTSGVALQYINLPLVEKTRIKKMITETGLEKLNKLILFISLKEGLIVKAPDISMKDFLYNEVKLNDTLPKDTLIELQQLQMELDMNLETKRNALKRLGRENIDELLEELRQEELNSIEVEKEKTNKPQLNSGFLNGQTPKEQVRFEVSGENKEGDIFKEI